MELCERCMSVVDKKENIQKLDIEIINIWAWRVEKQRSLVRLKKS